MEQLILDAEMVKAKMLPNPPGRHNPNNTPMVHCSVSSIDEDYLVVGGHLDESMQAKIKIGEYVDFGKLLPRDKILSDNESRMELVIKNGKTYWSPVSDSIVINGFSRWEQVFRIYTNIYTKEFPHRLSELIQYNHIIHSISSQYVWDNVYAYDKEFRMHLARHHPHRSWSVILQQAWSMRLRDRLSKGDSSWGSSSSHSNHNHHKQKGKPCRRYNRGKCNFGSSCRYDHRCSYGPCGKFGHSILNGRKLAADREKGLVKKDPVSQGIPSGRDTKEPIPQ